MTESNEKWHFILGDKLPTMYDAAIQIYQASPSPSSKKRVVVVHHYAVALHHMWQRSFGNDFVQSLTTVKNRLNGIMKDYDRTVKGRSHYGKIGKTIRHINKEWRQKSLPSHKGGGRPIAGAGKTYNNLLDIGKNTDKLKGAELDFYNDQKSARIGRLSEEIDVEYENEREKARKMLKLEDERQAQEESFSNPPEFIEVFNSTPRSERAIKYSQRNNDSNCHEDYYDSISPSNTPTVVKLQSNKKRPYSPRPDIRKSRNVSVDMKDAIASVSYRTSLSVEKARVAVQTVCEKLYHHNYYLTSEEQSKFEPSLSTISETDEPEFSTCKKPRSKEQYESQYKYVLPSAKVVSDFKHKKAMHQEIIAANALANLDDGTRVTLHYDTTSRSRIDGEWPSLILNFLNDDIEKCHMYPLRALFFAFEDRSQITKLVVETLERLSVASGGEKSAAQLWEKIYAFMTDAVTKNLKVEDQVAQSLNSNHVPYHILCKSHTCEKLDETCIDTLVYVENEIKLADLMIQRQPQLKSFLRQSKCIAVAAMKALLKLVSHENSAKPTSLAKEFDMILERENVAKSFSLYKERRFSKLGYTAGSLLDCVPYFRQLLAETHLTNMLVQACKLYLESDYILAAWKALSHFTYMVTMPYLNCVERCDQNGLLEILQRLTIDLRAGDLGTLSNYSVSWKHVKIEEHFPTSNLDKYLVDMMCFEGAKGVEMQCAKEYWAETETPRATQLHHLTENQRKNMPTENLSCERYLARFGALASISAAKKNKFFKAKRIRDDLMFEKQMCSEEIVKNSTKQIINQLESMEIKWTKGQKDQWTLKIEESLRKKSRSIEYQDVILRKCREHGGPIITIKDLNNLLSKSAEKDVKTYLRQEIIFQKLMHPLDAKDRSYLYKVNYLSVEQMVQNLTILLNIDEIGGNPENHLCNPLPTEEEIFQTISKERTKNKEDNDKEDLFELHAQQPLAVVWDKHDGERYWCIGFYLNEVDSIQIRVDHLTPKQDNVDWIRPKHDDIQNVLKIQVIPVVVIGNWDFSNSRQPMFNIKNKNEIDKSFENYLCE